MIIKNSVQDEILPNINHDVFSGIFPLQLAERIELAVGAVLDQGLRTADIAAGGKSIGTVEMGAAVVAALRDAGN